jgi:hypothetical protein
MPVHNHGTEEGAGLACREFRLSNGSIQGACMMSPEERMAGIVEKQAELKTLMERHILASTTILREFRNLSQEFNQASKDALKAAATPVSKTEFGPIDIPVRLGTTTSRVEGHATFYKFADGSTEVKIRSKEGSSGIFEAFFGEWLPLEIVVCASPANPKRTVEPGE